MVTNEWALKVSNLSKQFYSNQTILALSDISFQLNKGNILGLIGDNGAGKSTLLKIISGLIKPDAGIVSYRGNLSSILDIGSGFHPDLSGTDNIYMAGRLIGLPDKQIRESISDIIAFSELQNFIDTPLKYYSSGMFLRLAFTTTTCFNTDILLLDEVMSVGDLHFQQKAKNRIHQIVKDGSTVILAGHNIEALNELCTHGLWLTSGRQSFFGEINEVIDKYLAHEAHREGNSILPVNPKDANLLLAETSANQTGAENTVTLVIDYSNESYPEDNAARYIQYLSSKIPVSKTDKIIMLEAGVRAKGKSYEDDLYMDDELEIMIRYQKQTSNPSILFAVVQDKFGHNVMSLCTHRPTNNLKFIDTSSEGIFRQTVSVPAKLFNRGIFSVSFYFTDADEEDIAVFDRSLYFKIHKSEYSFDIFTYNGNFPGSLLPFCNWNSLKEL